ncbi:MAG: substrate-binding domain-containing protein, partial [Oceanipulchritudo sp.]
MEFATSGRGRGRIALILTPSTLRRLTPGLRPQVGPGRDFGWVDIGQRPARIVEDLHEMGPAGIIMEFREELTEQVSSLGFPVVVVLAEMLLEGMGSVNVDDEAIGEMAADYLRRKGLRSFAYCGMESQHAPGRKSGFLSALEGGEPKVHEVVAGEGGRSRRARLERWLGALPRPAGVFAAHDPLAREILEACGRLRLAVPSEVALLSAGNDPYTCELVYPGISSVEIPWERVSLEAGRLVGGMLAGEGPGEPAIVRPVGIHTRGSTDFYRVGYEWVEEVVVYMLRNL